MEDEGEGREWTCLPPLGAQVWSIPACEVKKKKWCTVCQILFQIAFTCVWKHFFITHGLD